MYAYAYDMRVLKFWCHIKNSTRQSMRTYLKSSDAKFHPDPISNDEALGFLRVSPQQLLWDHFLIQKT